MTLLAKGAAVSWKFSGRWRFIPNYRNWSKNLKQKRRCRKFHWKKRWMVCCLWKTTRWTGCHGANGSGDEVPVTVTGPNARRNIGAMVCQLAVCWPQTMPWSLTGWVLILDATWPSSVFDIPETCFAENHAKFKRELIARTKFGAGAGWRSQISCGTVWPRQFASAIHKNLHDKTVHQLQNFGWGNHFVEWGIIEFEKTMHNWTLLPEKYVALLTFGFARLAHCQAYSKLAKRFTLA